MQDKPETQPPEPPARSELEQDTESGVQIVRSNTPRPQSVSQATSFPITAPTSPPLPEELNESDENAQQDKTPLPLASAPEMEAPEFLWLFEYGPEMDAAYLNGPERLDGLALIYGPAVLQGYTITFDAINARAGQVTATIVPSRARGAEVWGILYRIPSRTARARADAPPLLDRIHSAAPPDGLFERLQIAVREAYRDRDIDCITFIASTQARNEYHLLPRHKQAADETYLQRLVETARKQKLPGTYVRELAQIAAPQPAPAEMGDAAEHNTEPLPVVGHADLAVPSSPREQEQTVSPAWQRGSIIFAVYMAVALVAALIVTLIQGTMLGSSLLAASFIPPGVPWFILVYGFMGGCVSGIVTLGRHRTAFPPQFVLITWFTRPFIGAVLAVIAYLLLNSGLFVLNGGAQQHDALFSLLAVVAGACEGWLFYRR